MQAIARPYLLRQPFPAQQIGFPIMAEAPTSPSDSRYIEDPAEILDCFRLFRDLRAQLNLRLDHSGDAAGCRVLDVTRREFIIEDITPRQVLGGLRKHPRFSISVRSDGLFAFVERVAIRAEGEERGLPYFYVPLPKRMLFQQRRHNPRFRLPLRVSAAGASITLFLSPQLTGRILDISAGACRVEFDLPMAHEIEPDQVIKDCAIYIPPRLEVHGTGVVRHCQDTGHQRFVAGIELTTMHVTDRRRLEQFIQSISRTSGSV